MRKTLWMAACAVLVGTVVASAGTLTLTIEGDDGGGYGATMTGLTAGNTYPVRIVGVLTTGDNEGLALFGVNLISGGDTMDLSAQLALTTPTGDMAQFNRNLGLTNPGSGAPNYGYEGTASGNDLLQVGGGQNTINNTTPPYPVGTPLALNVGHAGNTQVLAEFTLTAPADGDYTISLDSGFANTLDTTNQPTAVSPATVDDNSTLTINVSGVVTPPYIDGSWYSRKNHGSLGDLDKEFDQAMTGDPHTVQLDGTMTSPVDGVGVETRNGSVTELVLNFNEPMNPASILNTDITVNGNNSGPYNPTSISLVAGVNGADSELHMFFNAGDLPNGYATLTSPDRYVACINTNPTDVAGNPLDCTTGDCDVEFIAQFGNTWPAGASKYKVNPKDRNELIAHETGSALASPAVAVNFDVWNAGASNGKINPKDRNELIASEGGTAVLTTVPNCP